jgi:hypothetical protein
MSNGTYLAACRRHPWTAPNVIYGTGIVAWCAEGHRVDDDELPELAA